MRIVLINDWEILLHIGKNPSKVKAGPILESKNIYVIFQKKSRKIFKKGKIFKKKKKNVQNLKIF